MLDFKLNKEWDLEINSDGDISTTDSIIQAVKMRLYWFFGEWRLGPDLGFKYWELVFVKNPNESLIRQHVREQVLSVKGVTDVVSINLQIDNNSRKAKIDVKFRTSYDDFIKEVKIEKWLNTD